jgi:hypothetical protein
MDRDINPYFTQPDIVVLENLFEDVNRDLRGHGDLQDEKISPQPDEKSSAQEFEGYIHDKQSIELLKAYNDPDNAKFTPTIVTSWDEKDIPQILTYYIIKPYARIAGRIVRHPTDVVFLTHLIQYMTLNLGSAIWLHYRFTYVHGIAHTVYTIWCMGAFTLLMHNHIHNNGILSKNWVWVDRAFPYILEPLMGHTWDSYYYHHVKHHHVESNGMSQLYSAMSTDPSPPLG